MDLCYLYKSGVRESLAMAPMKWAPVSSVRIAYHTSRFVLRRRSCSTASALIMHVDIYLPTQYIHR